MDLGTPRNPWGAEKYPGVDVGSMEKILGLARRAGHLPPASQPRLDVDEEISKAKSSSERLISQLKTITGLRKEINRLQLEIQASTQETSTSDVTHARALQQRAAQVEDLAKHFSSILQQKDELLNRLTEPFAGEHIQSAASYHKFITAMFADMPPSLLALPKNIDDVTWASELSESAEVEPPSKLDSLSKTVAQCQEQFHLLLRFREAMDHAATKLHVEKSK